MAENNIIRLKRFKVFNSLKEVFLNEIKLSYAFNQYDSGKVLIVTYDNNVFGDNNSGVLGNGINYLYIQ
jgi:hypothetical protein